MTKNGKQYEEGRHGGWSRRQYGVIVGIAVGVACLAAVLLYSLTRSYVVSHAARNIESILLTQKGIHHYVQQVMHPALYRYKEEGKIPQDFYAPELFSSSFITRHQHEFFNEEREALGLPRVYYKMAATNPRNPVNLADAHEARLIRMFNENRDLKRFTEVQERDGAKCLYVALPFLENNEACLKCHGAREDAPIQLQDIYPGEGGFNEKLGQIRAIISIRMPLEHEFSAVYISLGAGLTGIVTILLLFFFNKSLRDKVQSRTRDLEQEIVERKKAQEALSKDFERFSAVMDSLDSLVYIADMTTYEVLFINRFGRDIWGDLAGKICWQSLQIGQSGPCPFCTNDRLLDQEGQPAGVYVWEFQNLVDNEWYECRDQAIRWTDGRLVRMEIATNITKRKQADDERLKLEGQLRQAQKMEAVGTLAGGIAHDFNNILTPILGYAEMLEDELPKEGEARSFLEEVKTAGNRAKDLVQQILAFSRKSEQERQPILLQPLIKETLKLLRSSIPTTIEIKEDIAPGRTTVLADPTQIHQVVMNLCTNAYHAMRETGGVLAVSLAEMEISKDDYLTKMELGPGTYLKLEVSDTGCGMTAAIRERIFEPYFTTKKKGEGTGMGLAVVHGIVQSHGGHITCYSEPDKGTTFHVYLPVVQEPAAARTIEAAEPVTHRGSERLLVVDDEKEIVALETRMLEGLGYRVTGCKSSAEALQRFQQDPAFFDLVITDMTMPEMTGAQLAQEIFKLRPDVPVVLCTGFSEVINAEKAKALGIREYLMKPISKKDLARVIRRILEEDKGA